MKSLRKELRRVCRFLFIAILLFPFVAHSAETSKEKISVAYAAISPSMSGVWMAKEIGAFERNGLTAELVYISSGATARSRHSWAAAFRPLSARVTR
jgi:ABC-type nitrate/sulfonate/bicarbonate transport system substrate-binding protein